MSEFRKFDNDEDILQSENKEKIELIKRLLEVNKNLLKTLYKDFYESEWFILFDFEMLTYITTIENTQKSLLKFTEKEKQLFLKLINAFSREYYYPPYFAALLNSIDKKEFSEFIDSLPDINTLSEEELRSISLLITLKKNYLNIKDYNSFKNLDFDSLINISRINLDEYKNIKLINSINISLEEARIICSKYCYDIETIECEEMKDIVILLNTIKKVVLAESISEVDELLNITYKKMEYPNLQTLIQNMYVKLYNKELYDTKDKEYQEIDGVKVFDAGLDFKMIVRSEGAFSQKQSNWNDNVRDNYSFSSSFISNNRLTYYGLQSSGLLTFGFNNLRDNSIVENSLGDNATIHRRRYTLDPRSYDDFKTPNKVTGDGCGQFFSTIDSINNLATRRVHTEITLERFYKNENGNEVRVQPSYIVYYIYNENFQNDELFTNSINAAKEFNIPLVTVNVKKVLLNEIDKVNKKYEECFTNPTIENIEELFFLYSNNYVDKEYVCDAAKEIYEEIFKPGAMDQMITNLLSRCDSLNKTPEFYQNLFDKLMIINEPKKQISMELLYKMYKKYNLVADTLKLTQTLEGIIPTGKYQVSEFYDFDTIITIEEIFNKYNIKISDLIFKLRKYKVQDTIKYLEKYNIPINEETITIDGPQIDRNISLCQAYGIEWDMDIVKIKNYRDLTAYLESIKQEREKDKVAENVEEENDDWTNDSFFDDWLDLEENEQNKFL